MGNKPEAMISGTGTLPMQAAMAVFRLFAAKAVGGKAHCCGKIR